MLVEVTDLTKANGRRFTLGPLSLSLKPGIHGLLGPNGAGKTTLLSVLATLSAPDSGTLQVGRARSVQRIRQSLGLLPQDNLPRSRITVREHLQYMAWLKKLPDLTAAAEEAASTAGVAEFLDRRLRHLSGGERRRVGIASALVGKPSLLILDEPSVGLDISQRSLISDTLERLRSRAVIIFSTHIVEDVVGHCDTITVLDRGAIRWHGSADEFAAESTAAYQARYLELVEP